MKLICKNKISHAMIALVLLVSFSILPTVSVFAQTFITLDQDVTAYTSVPGAKTHSGTNPYQGACAVHPKTDDDVLIPGDRPGQFPFGTKAVLSQAVPMYPGNTTRSIFTVEDTGDYDFVHSRSFIDVWQGTDYPGGTIWKWCINTFGTKNADITFFVN